MGLNLLKQLEAKQHHFPDDGTPPYLLYWGRERCFWPTALRHHSNTLNSPLGAPPQPGRWPGREGKRRCCVCTASCNGSVRMLRGLFLFCHPGGLDLRASSGILTAVTDCFEHLRGTATRLARKQKFALMENKLYFHPTRDEM